MAGKNNSKKPDLTNLIISLRDEVRSEFKEVRSEFKEEFKELRTEMNRRFDSHAADIHGLEEKVTGALDGVKLSLDKLAPLETIPERTATLEREVGAIKIAIKNISAIK